MKKKNHSPMGLHLSKEKILSLTSQEDITGGTAPTGTIIIYGSSGCPKPAPQSSQCPSTWECIKEQSLTVFNPPYGTRP